MQLVAAQAQWSNVCELQNQQIPGIFQAATRIQQFQRCPWPAMAVQIPSGAAADLHYANPLVCTSSSLGHQTVLVFSEANRMYIVDAVNGTLIATRDLSLGGEGPVRVFHLPSRKVPGGTVSIVPIRP
jgi:hypothetical protein